MVAHLIWVALTLHPTMVPTYIFYGLGSFNLPQIDITHSHRCIVKKSKPLPIAVPMWKRNSQIWQANLIQKSFCKMSFSVSYSKTVYKSLKFSSYSEVRPSLFWLKVRPLYGKWIQWPNFEPIYQFQSNDNLTKSNWQW